MRSRQRRKQEDGKFAANLPAGREKLVMPKADPPFQPAADPPLAGAEDCPAYFTGRNAPMSMKNKMLYAIVFAALSLVVFVLFESQQPAAPASPSPSTLQWEKHPGNPVVPEMESGTWNHWPGDPFVMKDGNAYKMWYGGYDESTEKTQIGYAESENGIEWRHHPNPVVPAGPPSSYDAKDVETPTVLKDGDIYHMWYSVTRGKESEEAIYQIAHATSQDGIQWIKDPKNPVLLSPA